MLITNKYTLIYAYVGWRSPSTLWIAIKRCLYERTSSRNESRLTLSHAQDCSHQILWILAPAFLCDVVHHPGPNHLYEVQIRWVWRPCREPFKLPSLFCHLCFLVLFSSIMLYLHGCAIKVTKNTRFVLVHWVEDNMNVYKTWSRISCRMWFFSSSVAVYPTRRTLFLWCSSRISSLLWGEALSSTISLRSCRTRNG